MIRRALIALAAVALLSACGPAPIDTKAVGPENTSEADIGNSPSEKPEDGKVTKVGAWAAAEDGVEFRVSKLAKGTVSDVAAGGKQGDPAVIVTVQMRNNGKVRFDMSEVSVSVRVGEDGQEAEQIYQEGVDDSFDGTLAPGRTATVRQMYGGKARSDLKVVSVEISPGYEYDSFTFEGGI